MNSPPLRGSIYMVDMGETDDAGQPLGEKPWLIVSNNERNRALDTALAVRITTTLKRAHLATNVELDHHESFRGVVLCDEITVLYASELTPAKRRGGVTPATMERVSRALSIALGITQLPTRTR